MSDGVMCDQVNRRILVFSSGGIMGGGSGFQELIENSLAGTGILDADIVAVVSNNPHGGVKQRADKFFIPFELFQGPWTEENYGALIDKYDPDLVVLSGWLKLAVGMDPQYTINIHPGPLPEYGGKGMYGHHVHEKLITDFKAGKVKNSAVSMHFVTEEYDEGPVFFKFPVRIRDDDTPETLAARVNKVEHTWQPWITNLVLTNQIYWDGSQNPGSLSVPSWYEFADDCDMALKISDR